jgi:hypothetical protein
MLQEKHVVAILPSEPKHCPKCRQALEECDALYMIWEPAMTRLNCDSPRRNYYCMHCDCWWKPEQIPDHQEYDPTECPQCHEHARREIDVEPSGNYLTHVYVCTVCGKIWNVRKPR